ncbi:uncharacterized protein [Watersipora subatra]|uniref:uncharacterized protein n=1 Tax=Watersipora subatra TaxID=2589382 RepID=UPI00355BEEED
MSERESSSSVIHTGGSIGRLGNNHAMDSSPVATSNDTSLSSTVTHCSATAVPAEYRTVRSSHSQQTPQGPYTVLSINPSPCDSDENCPRRLADYHTTTNPNNAEGSDSYRPFLSSHHESNQPSCLDSQHITTRNPPADGSFLTLSDPPTSDGTLPILNMSAGFTVTELPSALPASYRSETVRDMQNHLAPAYNNPTDCMHPSILNMGQTLVCELREPAQPRRRRGRRERRRRRRRRRHRSRHHRRSSNHTDDDSYVKPDCCSALACRICLANCMEFKKVLVFFASSGIICVLIGIILGVLKSPGNHFFIMSLSFVALGVLLLIIVLIGWRCVPASQQPCHRLFNLGNFCSQTRRNRRRRQRQSWFGRRMNPEFRFRPPPPSYASAMQDQRSHLRHLAMESLAFTPGSPPPSYKSHTSIERPGIHIIFPRNNEFPTSNPPTYRLRNSPERPSLTALQASNFMNDSQDVSARFSVSSTTALVEAEQCVGAGPTEGVVNMSFTLSDHHTVDMSSLERDRSCQITHADAVRPSNTIGESTHTDSVFRNIPQSIAVILEDDHSSTL